MQKHQKPENVPEEEEKTLQKSEKTQQEEKKPHQKQRGEISQISVSSSGVYTVLTHTAHVLVHCICKHQDYYTHSL